MGLVINVDIVEDEDYDGNPITIKQAHAHINGEQVNVGYSYDGAKLDAEIEAEVEADLTSRGYSW